MVFEEKLCRSTPVSCSEWWKYNVLLSADQVLSKGQDELWK